MCTDWTVEHNFFTFRKQALLPYWVTVDLLGLMMQFFPNYVTFKKNTLFMITLFLFKPIANIKIISKPHLVIKTKNILYLLKLS